VKSKVKAAKLLLRSALAAVADDADDKVYYNPVLSSAVLLLHVLVCANMTNWWCA
jgi:hypothetical protein